MYTVTHFGRFGNAPRPAADPRACPDCGAAGDETFLYRDPDGSPPVVICMACIRCEYGIPGGPRHAPQAA